ncbi:MAG: ROK family transcriptional regulator [Cyclobacteriaceae bacterium]
MSEDIIYSDKPETSLTQNKVRVLGLIRNKKETTRSEIIKLTQLSAPTVTKIIDALIDEKVITHDELGSSKGGRPPQIIRFDSKNNYVIGVDIGGTFVRAALSNLDCEFSYEIHQSTEITNGFEGIMAQVGSLIEKLVIRAESQNDRVFGIGVSVRGLVNSKTEKVAYSPVFKWTNVDIKNALKKYTDLKIAIGNDAQLNALGELFFGIGNKYDHFITFKLGFGIGAGIVVNRQPFQGWEGYTGEIGHIIVDPHSKKKGREGIDGTLEVLASGYGIEDVVKQMLNEGQKSSLADHLPSTIDTRSVINAAINGDELAAKVVDSACQYIGISIDTLIKLFNPQAISLSGGMLRNNYLIKRIEEKVESSSLSPYKGKVPILPSSFGEEASLMGAISLILQNILSLKYDDTPPANNHSQATSE